MTTRIFVRSIVRDDNGTSDWCFRQAIESPQLVAASFQWPVLLRQQPESGSSHNLWSEFRCALLRHTDRRDDVRSPRVDRTAGRASSRRD